MHEIFFDAALSDARAADAYLATHGKPMGPLHGLPISLKDQMHVKGVPTSMGYIGWLDLPPHPRESLMVTTLRSLGAILYVKTACPQTLISGETQNNIIDYTWNPANRLLSCGGSSGGEAALIACKGSPLGMGTDYTGSIRIPSAFCGIFGLRPSGGRMSYQDMANSMDGQNSMLSVVGPMGGSPRDLALIMRSVLATEPWLHDPLVNEIPWRSELEQEARNLIDAAAAPGKPRLAFGLLRHDGSVRPHPPIARALDIVADALTKQGHAVIPWEPPNHARADIIGMTTWVYDGGADVHKAFALSGEPVSEQIQRVYGTQPSNQLTGEQSNANNVAKREFQREYAAYWNGTVAATGTGRPVDAVILPQAAHAAARPKMYFYAGYTTVGSVLDYPTVIVPVTRVDKSVDIADTTYQGVGEMDSLVWSTCEYFFHSFLPPSSQLQEKVYERMPIGDEVETSLYALKLILWQTTRRSIMARQYASSSWPASSRTRNCWC